MFKPNSSPEDIASFVENAFEEAQQARMPVERQWLLNLAFYYGKQWVTWGPVANNTARLIEPKAPKWRTRLVINKIEPYVRREMSRLSTMKPRGYVMPASPDEGDKSAARVAEQIADYLHEETQLEIAMEKVDWWTCIAGPGFLKTRFTEEIDPATNLPGRLRVDALRPFDIYVADQEETRVQEQEWIMQVSSMSHDKVKELWGVDVQGTSGVSEVEQRVRNVMSIFNEKKGNQVLVKEMWVKPCPKFPKGVVVSVANGTILPMAPTVELDEFGQEIAVPSTTPEGTIEWPYAHGKYPFTRRGHTMSGKFYDTSFVWTIISLQREYNRTRSQIIENKNITSRPQWAMQRGSVDKNQLTTEPGAVIQYAPGSTPPIPIQTPQLANYVMDHLRLTAEEMDEIASQNAVSKGSVPPGVEAATAIAYLQERDDAAVGYAIRSRERAYQEVTQQLLSLVQEFWDAERVVRVVGQNSNFDAFVLKGADLKGNTDYRVVVGSGTPVSRAAQKAEIMELWKGGGLPGGKALRALNMPDMEAVINEVEIDAIHAQRENLKMSRNVWETVGDFHDHIAHVDEHDNFRKKEEFQGLNPMVQQMVRFHVYLHMQMLAQFFNRLPVDSVGALIEPEQAPLVNGPEGPMSQPFFVDPVYEMELRKIFIQLKAGAGAPEEEGPTP